MRRVYDMNLRPSPTDARGLWPSNPPPASGATILAETDRRTPMLTKQVVKLTTKTHTYADITRAAPTGVRSVSQTFMATLGSFRTLARIPGFVASSQAHFRNSHGVICNIARVGPSVSLTYSMAPKRKAGGAKHMVRPLFRSIHHTYIVQIPVMRCCASIAIIYRETKGPRSRAPRLAASGPSYPSDFFHLDLSIAP